MSFFNTLPILYLNARSLLSRNKLELIKSIATEHNPSIIAIVETWFKDTDEYKDINIEGYIRYRKDRHNSGTNKSNVGGGVCIFVKNNLRIETIKIKNIKPDIDYLTIKIKNDLNPEFLTIIYRPPISSSYKINDNDLIDLMENIKELEGRNNFMSIIGDFNIPIKEWDNNDCHNSQLLHTYLLNNDLKQIINKPTRKNHLLDLFLTNYPAKLIKIEHIKTDITDHDIILAKMNNSNTIWITKSPS